jgi:PAS domain-containing protein
MSSKPTYKELEQKVLELEKTVSEHKMTKDALIESENRYRSIVRVIPDLIIKFNREGIYLDVISSKDELLYMPREELLGLKLTDIMRLKMLLIEACK